MKKIMRNVLCIMLAVILAVGVVTIDSSVVFAAVSGDYRYILSGGTATIIEYTGEDAEVTIPAELDGYKVTSIYEWAFANRKSMTSVKIPDGVTYIDINAFVNCSNLTSVEIPDSVTHIEVNAFARCISLESIKIPAGVTYIGTWAFSGCSSLTSIVVDAGNEKYKSDEQGVLYNSDQTTLLVCPGGKEEITIPTSVTSIAASAFEGCGNITDIEIPTGVQSIGDGAFKYCSSLASIEIPTSVESIWADAFSGCQSLTSIEIPFGVKNICTGTFYYCNSLKSVTIPASVESIGESAFWKCSSLASIEIPASVESIGGTAFCDCSSLESIAIPVSVESIGKSAFASCYKLTRMEILSSVTDIGDEAFHNCDNLTICGYTGSYAEAYSIENNITFESLGDVPKDISVATIILDKTSVSLDKGDSVTLSATILPVKATNKNVMWSSSDTNIATVDENGNVTAVAKGEAVITVAAADGSNVNETCTVTVTEPVTSVTLNKTSISLEKGSSESLKATVLPENATNSAVTWSSSDTNIATVDENGKVTAVAKGTAVINVTAADGSGKTASCTVTVTEPTTPTTPTEPTTPQTPTTPTTPTTPALTDISKCSISFKASVAYRGKKITPAVKVKNGKTKLAKGTDYTVTYSKNKKIGKAIITIKGTGKYKGKVKKTFKIVPKKQKIKKLTAVKKGFKVSYKKAKKAEATGYRIRYAVSKKALKKAKAVNVKSYKTAAKSISKLKAGKKYFVQVRTYKKIGKDTYYGAWSAVKSIKTKK